VSGIDEQALQQALAPYRSRPDIVWRRSEPGLEDVFIKMMDHAPDNFDA
jgi:ABC-2 type transport system ATP-binding protein